MVSSAATTVEAYLAELPPERREVVATLRDVVNAHLPAGYREAMSYGMIGWCVPLARYPDTYNKQPLAYAALAAQKNNYSLYLMCVYEDDQRERALRAAAAAQGKALDMGKSCIRFKRIDQLPLEAIGALIASLSVDEFIALYEDARASAGGAKPAASKSNARKPGAAKASASKPAASKPAAPKPAASKRAAPKRAASQAAASKPPTSKPAKTAKAAKAIAKRTKTR
jgi:hypothetical protein